MTGTPPKLPTLFEMFVSAAASSAAAKAEVARPPWPLNPFPRGMREGCCTQRVLDELRRVHPQHLEHGQLRFNLNASRGMVTWALRYLEAHGQVQRLPDPRNPAFRRWRAVVPAPTFGEDRHD